MYISLQAALLAGLLAEGRIHDIQGVSHVSPFAGQEVAGIEGVVTAVEAGAFYLQDPVADDDERTSEAVHVRSAGTVTLGDRVLVDGIVHEVRPACAACSPLDAAYANLATTEIAARTVTVVGHEQRLPSPLVIGSGALRPPREVTAGNAPLDVEDGARLLEPRAHAIDFYESLEAMRVALVNPVAVGSSVALASGGVEIAVVAGGAPGDFTAHGGLRVTDDSPHAERLFLSGDLGVSLPELAVGDALSGTVVGVLDYAFGKFEVRVTGAGPTAIRRPRAMTALGPTATGDLSVATFNLENLGPGRPTKLARLADIIVRSMAAPDVVALQEVQDSSGPVNDGTVDATAVEAALVEAIVAAGGPRYAAVDVAPEDNQDGGEPGANIRVGVLYRSEGRLSLVDRPPPGPHTANRIIGAPPEIAWSPGRIAPDAPAFLHSRKPIAVEWMIHEEDGRAPRPLFLIVVHFISQRTDPPLFGRFQPAPKPSRAQRREQAREVADFVREILGRDPEARVIVAGDLNDIESSPPLQELEESGLHDLMTRVPEADRYTEIFQGGAQTLDHILVSATLAEATTLVTIPHVDADFPGPASDHDPVVARFRWKHGPQRGCSFASARSSPPSWCGAFVLLVIGARRGGRPFLRARRFGEAMKGKWAKG